MKKETTSLNQKACTKTRKRLLFIHDYPPKNGGGLGINIYETALTLSKYYDVEIVTSRIKDHFVNDSHESFDMPVKIVSRSIKGVLFLIHEIKNSDLTIVNLTFSFHFGSVVSLLLLPILKRRYICIFHSRTSHLDYNRLRRMPKFLVMFLFNILSFSINKSNRNLVLSRNQKDELTKHRIRNLEVLPMIFRFKREYFRNYLTRLNSSIEPNVYYIGEISELKGIIYLIEAAKILNPKIPIILVGNGPDKQKYLDMLKSSSSYLKLNVSFQDGVPHRMVPEILRNAFLIIVPSLSDAWPRIIIEAMICGVPVLANRLESISEMIRNQETGIIVDIKDRSKVVAMIYNIIENRQKRSEMIEKAHKYVLTEYSGIEERWRQMINQILEVH